MNTSDYINKVLTELEIALTGINDKEIEKLIQAILTSKKIFLAGAGRSGLMIKAFAMRLIHMGFTAYVVGETITPAIASGDLLIIGSGSGSTDSLVVIVGKARSY